MDEHLGADLSALLDGSLHGEARAAAEAHLRACATCRAEADAIEATLGDLRALPRPVLSEMDAARVRARLQQERRAPRWNARLGAAAVVALLVAGGVTVALRDDASSDKGGLLASAPAEVQSVDYDESSARGLLEGGTEARSMAKSEDSVLAPSAAGPADPGGAGVEGGADTGIPAIDHAQRIAECEKTFLGTEDVERVHRIAAMYEGEPAYLLSYRVPKGEPTHMELWVVSISECSVRLFAQEQL